MRPDHSKADDAGERSSRGARSIEWVRTRAPRFARWFVLLFIASLVVPALTKQWSDRKQELQLKETLATDISKVSANAVLGAEFANYQQTGVEQRAARREVVDDWLRDRATIDPRFQVYFPGSAAEAHWGVPGRRNPVPSFRNAVLYYTLMACCDSGKARKVHVASLHAYLGGARASHRLRDPWGVLACGPQEECAEKPKYSLAYMWLGEQLLHKRRVLFDQLLDANGRGFSSGWGDFIRDLNPVG